MCEEGSDYGMKLYLNRFYNKQYQIYKIYTNCYIEGTKLIILISEDGYADAQHVFVNTKSQGVVDVLAKIHDNCEKCFKKYFKTFIFEATMNELSKTEYSHVMFNDINVIYKDEIEQIK